MSNFGTFGENNPVWKAVNRFADMMLIGILFIITCIPIVTIGASLCAFYYTVMDSLRKEDGYIFRRYFTNFGKNFKKGTLIWLIMLGLFVICVVNLLCWTLNYDMVIAPVMLVISVILTLVWLMTFVFVFPLQARFENKIGQTIQNAFLLAISHLPFTISVILLLGILGFLCAVSWLAVFCMLLFGIGVAGYLLVYNFERFFKKCGYIEEDDGKIKNDDYDFEVDVDFEKIHAHTENTESTVTSESVEKAPIEDSFAAEEPVSEEAVQSENSSK